MRSQSAEKQGSPRPATCHAGTDDGGQKYNFSHFESLRQIQVAGKRHAGPLCPPVKRPSTTCTGFRCHNPSGRTMALVSTQPLTEISSRNISCRCIRLTISPTSCAEICEASTSWNPLGLQKACTGIALSFTRCTGAFVGTKVGLHGYRERKMLPSNGFETPTVQTVACPYTDYAMPGSTEHLLPMDLTPCLMTSDLQLQKVPRKRRNISYILCIQDYAKLRRVRTWKDDNEARTCTPVMTSLSRQQGIILQRSRQTR